MLQSVMKVYASESRHAHSRGFLEYVAALGDAVSGDEVDALVRRDVTRLRAALASPSSQDWDKLRECVVRVLYAEMLGCAVPFAHIHGINLASAPSLLCKRTGYLATALCVPPEHATLYLVVATLQRDCQSSNFVVVATALTAAARLLRPELMHIVRPALVGLATTHAVALVRRKAVEALHALYVKTQGTRSEWQVLHRALGDVEPCVVDAALRWLEDVLWRLMRHVEQQQQHASSDHNSSRGGDVSRQHGHVDSSRGSAVDEEALLEGGAVVRACMSGDWVVPLLQLLTQVIERRLPRSYDFHTVPAPWMQMRLVRLLTLLLLLLRSQLPSPPPPSSASSASASLSAYATAMAQLSSLLQQYERVLMEVLRRADGGARVGLAVISTVVQASAPLHDATPSLQAMCVHAIGALLQSSKANIRYAGVQVLARVAAVDASLAAEHADTILTCLADADATVRARSIDILFALCNRDNCAVLARRLRGLLTQRRRLDVFVRRSTAQRLCAMLLRCVPPHTMWYVTTMNDVLACAADCVPPSAAQQLIRYIAQEEVDDDDDNNNDDDEHTRQRRRVAAVDAFRAQCVSVYWALTDTTSDAAATLPAVLLRVAAWVLGEYGYLHYAAATAAAAASHNEEDKSKNEDNNNNDSTATMTTTTTRMAAAAAHTSSVTVVSNVVLFVDRLCDLCERAADATTRAWLLTALAKTMARADAATLAVLVAHAQPLLRRYSSSRSVELQQRCRELLELVKTPQLLRDVLRAPRHDDDDGDDSDDDDVRLSFLDAYVDETRRRGALPYASPSSREARTRAVAAAQRSGVNATAALSSSRGSVLRTEPYAPAATTTTTMMLPTVDERANSISNSSSGGGGGAVAALTAASAAGHDMTTTPSPVTPPTVLPPQQQQRAGVAQQLGSVHRWGVKQPVHVDTAVATTTTTTVTAAPPVAAATLPAQAAATATAATAALASNNSSSSRTHSTRDVRFVQSLFSGLKQKNNNSNTTVTTATTGRNTDSGGGGGDKSRAPRAHDVDALGALFASTSMSTPAAPVSVPSPSPSPLTSTLGGVVLRQRSVAASSPPQRQPSSLSTAQALVMQLQVSKVREATVTRCVVTVASLLDMAALTDVVLRLRIPDGCVLHDVTCDNNSSGNTDSVAVVRGASVLLHILPAGRTSTTHVVLVPSTPYPHSEAVGSCLVVECTCNSGGGVDNNNNNTATTTHMYSASTSMELEDWLRPAEGVSHGAVTRVWAQLTPSREARCRVTLSVPTTTTGPTLQQSSRGGSSSDDKTTQWLSQHVTARFGDVVRVMAAATAAAAESGGGTQADATNSGNECVWAAATVVNDASRLVVCTLTPVQRAHDSDHDDNNNTKQSDAAVACDVCVRCDDNDCAVLVLRTLASVL